MNAATPAGLSERVFAQFLTIEQRARAAATCDQLAYSIVNDSQPLFGYRHAVLLIAAPVVDIYRVRAVTGIATVEPHAPFVAFVEHAVATLRKPDGLDGPGLNEATPIAPQQLGAQEQQDWQALSAAHALWLPLLDRNGVAFGGVWLARDNAWTPGEQLLLQQLAATHAHAWLALQPQPSWRRQWPRKKILAIAAAIVVVLLLPVRQSVLAPAEVVPQGGQVVAAPLDGVIADIVVKPNQRVQAGDVLLRFDTTSLKAQADVAQRALGVAEAELKTSGQRAFTDAESGARLDLLQARVEQKQAERDFAADLLARAEVRAERDGIAVFADAQRWTGKPVQTGERLMQIAAPTQAELRIELAVGDAIDLPPAAAVALFLDSDPLHRHDATLQRQAYEAQITAAGQLAYRLDANFVDAPPRIGLRGTAKLYGQRVPLCFYLLRRPLAALRQTLGF
jgi:hypothetical protein